MSNNLVNQAITNPDTPEHFTLFRTRWLPKVSSANSETEHAQIIDSHLALLYPDIYRYGPNYQKLVNQLKHIDAHLNGNNSNAFISNFTNLTDLFNQFYRANYDTWFANNPDFAYRDNNSHQIDLQIPHYQACVDSKNLNDWLYDADYRTGENVDLIDEYKTAILQWDIMDQEHLDFQPYKNEHQKFETKYNLTS